MRGRPEEPKSATPTPLLMHVAMVLSGLGTTILGPILPLLTAHWQLRDAQAGLLLTAQFVGLSLGSIAISRRLVRSYLVGIATSLAGFGGLALAAAGPAGPSASKFVAGCVAAGVAGLGLGQLITSVNLIGGRRYSSRRGSALSLLNFFWSFGAVLSPLMAAWFTPRFSLAELLSALTCGFLLLGIEATRQIVVGRGLPTPRVSDSQAGDAGAPNEARGISIWTLVYFAVLFFLYGGVESGLNGWLTTYAVRYGRHGLSMSESSTLLFWIALAAGRALSVLVLLRVGERSLRTASLAAAVLFTAALIYSGGAWSGVRGPGSAASGSLAAISVCAVLLGLSLAPWFPASLSLLLARKPHPRQAAVVLAVTGLGGATLAWMMGQASTRTGSLHAALWIPFTGAAALFALCVAGAPRRTGRTRYRGWQGLERQANRPESMDG